MNPCRNGLPADRADLARRRRSRRARRPSQRLADGTGVVVGLGEHVRAPPVAGEEQRAGRPGRRPGRRRGSGGGPRRRWARRARGSGASGRRAPARRARGRPCPRRRRAGRASGSRRAGTRTGSRRSRGPPGPRRCAASCCSSSRESVPRSRLQPLERRLARELEDDVALGAGDHGVAADRARSPARRPCGRARRGARRRRRPRCSTSPSRKSACVSGSPAPAASPPTSGTRVLLLVQLREEAGRGEGERVDEQRDEVRRRRGSGMPLTATPVVGVERDAVEGLDLGLRQRGRPDGRAGARPRARGRARPRPRRRSRAGAPARAHASTAASASSAS